MKSGNETAAHARQALDAAAAIKAGMITDKERLDWLDTHQFTAYRDRDPEHGTLGHAVVVNEDAKGSRRGQVGTAIREAIDLAMRAEKSAQAGAEWNSKAEGERT